MTRASGLAIAALAACSRSAPLASCDDDLRGVYVAGAERWMILDNGSTLEAYPVLPDGAFADGLVAAPRAIDLERVPAGAGPPGQPAGAVIQGTLHQRFMRRAERCDAQVGVRVARCAGDTIELVLADPSPPLAFSPCAWPRAAPSRVVRWRRE